jgi:hypothetical protein
MRGRTVQAGNMYNAAGSENTGVIVAKEGFVRAILRAPQGGITSPRDENNGRQSVNGCPSE